MLFSFLPSSILPSSILPSSILPSSPAPSFSTSLFPLSLHPPFPRPVLSSPSPCSLCPLCILSPSHKPCSSQPITASVLQVISIILMRLRESPRWPLTWLPAVTWRQTACLTGMPPTSSGSKLPKLSKSPTMDSTLNLKVRTRSNQGYQSVSGVFYSSIGRPPTLSLD